MLRQCIWLISLLFLLSQNIDAQSVLNGLILDSETLEPIIGATISDATKNKPLAISDAEGQTSPLLHRVI